MTRRHAFTLIELLVVVSIISLLIAMLLPALGKARAAAQLSLCTSNHKNVMLGMVMFAQDHRDKLPPNEVSGASDGTRYWYSKDYVGGYLGTQWSAPFQHGRNVLKVLQCPTINSPQWQQLGIGYNECWDSDIRSVKTSAFAAPPKTIILADTSTNNVPGQWDYDTNNTAGFLSFRWAQLYRYDGAPRHSPNYTRWVTYRHSQNAAVAFADGHVRTYMTTQIDNGINTHFGEGLHKAFLEKRVIYKSK